MMLVTRDCLLHSFVSLLLLICVGEVLSQCSLNPNLKADDDKKPGTPRQTLLAKINRIDASIRNTEIKVDHDHDTTYSIRICPDVSQVKDFSAFNELDQNTPRSLGRMNESDVMMATTGDILFLIYTNGDDYRGACNKTERRTVTMIRAFSGDKPRLVRTEESVGKDEEFCFYMFELYVPASYFGDMLKLYPGDMSASSSIPHVTVPTTVLVDSTVVPTQKSIVTPSPTTGLPANAGVAAAQTGTGAAATATLSTGSIILILVLVPLVLFFAVGSVYKRFVVGAQGWEQVPFIDFWRGCWSMQADGWRFVFGRRVRGNSYNDYTAVSTDEERQPALDRGSSANNDDHLLPM